MSGLETTASMHLLPGECRAFVRSPKRKQAEQELAYHEDQMLALESLMISMEHKRFELLEKLNSATLWWSTLPLEITIEIFSLVCEAQDPADYAAFPATYILGGVCKAWQNVIFSMPRFWDTLTICFTSANYHMQKELVTEWSSRSGALPLHLYLDAALSQEWEPDRVVFEFLLKSSSRWKSLDTFIFNGLSLALQRDGVKELRFPLLQELRLHGDREGCAPHTQDMHFRFAESNQLRIFRDKATSLDYAFTLYFGQLKELDIQLGPDN